MFVCVYLSVSVSVCSRLSRQCPVHSVSVLEICRQIYLFTVLMIIAIKRNVLPYQNRTFSNVLDDGTGFFLLVFG